ncbi:cytochrome P450 superfamily protein [Striga asiatica]|uniref:Flavonoid-6-hydroxylase n=1 Tax=Striga asiatica TaxID=4170 RepID=A0A5A7QAK1_STRAF|nr:cytochrome P450 superfamily protein [Striga asiatica]
MSTATLTLVLLTSLIAVSLYAALRRRRLPHPPLPPGPRPWPILGNLPQIGPKPHQSMAALARVYGPILHLRMGFVHVVVAASAQAAEQFLRAHDANFSSRPPNSGAKHVAYNYQDMVFGPYGPRWRLMRKISALHLFSGRALDDFRHVREEEVGILVRDLLNAGPQHAPVRLGQILYVCATNALARATLGRRVFGGVDEKSEEFKGMVVELMVLSGVLNIGDFIPVLEGFDLQGVVSKMKKLHNKFDTFLSKVIEERKAEGLHGAVEQHMDLLGALISMKDVDDGEKGRLTEIEIKALLLNMFVAGTDTTSSTVEWAIAELLRHPKILAQAQQELDSVVGKDRLVSESDLSRLTYLQAVVKENFRLHPSTPLSLPRIAQDSCVVNGYLIPKGSTLLVNVWAIARDPDVWPDPLDFRPERFLPGGEGAGVDVRGNDFEVIPFGSGRRICAGVSLAMRMVQLLIASLVHGFDFELAGGQSAHTLNMEEAYGLTLQRAEPLMVHARPRLETRAYGGA